MPAARMPICPLGAVPHEVILSPRIDNPDSLREDLPQFASQQDPRNLPSKELLPPEPITEVIFPGAHPHVVCLPNLVGQIYLHLPVETKAHPFNATGRPLVIVAND